MKKKSVLLLTAMLLCTAVIALFASGCAKNGGMSMETPKPSAAAGASASPKASASPSQTASASPSAEATGALGSETAMTEGASASPSADVGASIEGFMEGGIVDPDDVPELTALFAKAEEYKDAAIQSITYKLYEGRQAYYVVLNGTEGAERTVYVLGDGSIIPAD